LLQQLLLPLAVIIVGFVVVTGTLSNTSLFCWLSRTMCGHVCHGCQHEIYGFSKHLNFVICHTYEGFQPDVVDEDDDVVVAGFGTALHLLQTIVLI